MVSHSIKNGIGSENWDEMTKNAYKAGYIGSWYGNGQNLKPWKFIRFDYMLCSIYLFLFYICMDASMNEKGSQEEVTDFDQRSKQHHGIDRPWMWHATRRCDIISVTPGNKWRSQNGRTANNQFELTHFLRENFSWRQVLRANDKLAFFLGFYVSLNACTAGHVYFGILTVEVDNSSNSSEMIFCVTNENDK